ncbi:TIGR03560 family F420-dependent LLM class oxidoreductase [Candidatus Hecatella orcuttiae]|jgi:F420-dependent oxidoreductase-like protein|uniref:TIGR03560 family F420-dependent LLM class oxidoreductase n=1 Tax=Candidatus Hecatella orcuttiae TaxID=1935119 RepID=UPI00286809A0|nr:TIGR03560 family F420-dependent LLM class oxidoreductase [Candidatus Hecatella orcuttiae]
MGKPLRFGVHTALEGLGFEDVQALCLEAERLGYDFFTVTDHFYPMGEAFYPNSGYPLECWSALAALAAVTAKIRIGPLVTCTLYRNPLVLTKAATTVDIISHGRLTLGLGAGWYEKEFKAFFGVFPPAAERFQRFEEEVQIIKSMLENRETTHRGRYYRLLRVENLPPPVQKPRPPILIGGTGEKRLLKIAAKHADEVQLYFNLPEAEVKRKVEVLKEHCKNVGRNFGNIALHMGLYVFHPKMQRYFEDMLRHLAQVENRPLEKIRENYLPPDADPEEYVGLIRKYSSLGINCFNLVPIGPLPERGSMLRRFAEEVKAVFKA